MATRVTSLTVGIGTLRKQGKWWHFRWSDAAGNRRSVALKVTNQRVAEQKARKLSESIEAGNLPKREKRKLQSVSFAEAGQEFVDYVRESGEWEKSTAEGYQKILDRMIGLSRPRQGRKVPPVPVPFSDSAASSVSRQDIEGYLLRRVEQDKIAVATRNRELAFFKSMFKKLKEWGHVLANPAAEVKMIQETQKPVEALTEEELERLLAVLEKRGGLAYDVALAAADTGLRIGSLQAMRWKHVDWEERVVRLPTSKSKKGLVIPLTQRLSEHLKVMFEKASSSSIEGTKVIMADIGEMPVFISSDPAKPFNSIRKGLSTAGKEAGVGHVHPHMLRHTFGTHLVNAEVHPFLARDLMGHKKLETTLRYYHSNAGQFRKAMEALEARRG